MQNKIMTFKVSFSKEIYRVIEIPADHYLDQLAEAILDAFDFDCDHAYGFYNNVRSIRKSNEKYELFADIEDCETDEDTKGVEGTLISDAFEPKKKMAFLFDYGDQWIFNVNCKSISERLCDISYPRVIKTVGTAPEQYPSYDEH